MRLFKVAFVLVLTGALVWAGWLSRPPARMPGVDHGADFHRRRRRICLREAAAFGCHDLDDEIAGLRQGLAGRAVAIATVVVVAASGPWFRLPVRTR